MRKKKEKKERETTLLQELCGADAELYACLSTHLYETPVAAVSQQDLDVLIKEAEESGNFRPALDKAIFEGAQNPGERERYVEVVQTLASKITLATEQEREEAEKKGLTDLAASLGRRIEDQKVMGKRAEDILDVASKFYNEKLVESEEDARRKARQEEREEAEREELRIGEREQAGREGRRRTRRAMGREERREAKKKDRQDKLAAEERKEAREQKRQELDREEERIGEREQAGREARKEERTGD